MDFKKIGKQLGRVRETAKEKVGDRAEPENLKRDGKDLRAIFAGDGSLADKAKQAKEKLSDPNRSTGTPAPESSPPGEDQGNGRT